MLHRGRLLDCVFRSRTVSCCLISIFIGLPPFDTHIIVKSPPGRNRFSISGRFGGTDGLNAPLKNQRGIFYSTKSLTASIRDTTSSLSTKTVASPFNVTRQEVELY